MRVFIIILISLAMAFGASAQSMADWYSHAAAHSPKVKAAYQQYLSMLKAGEQVGPLDPQLSAGYFITPMMMPDGEQRAMFTLMQMFPWFGTLQTERDMRRKMAEAEYQMFLQEINMVFTEMREMFIEWAELEAKEAYYKEQLRILDDMESLALAELESGMGSLERVIELRAEQDEAENELLGISHTRASVLQMVRIVSGKEHSELRLPDDFELPQFDEKGLHGRDFASHPLIQKMRLEREAFDLEAIAARKMGQPMFGIGLSYTLVAPLSGMEAMNPRNLVQPMLNLSLPIYRKKYQAGIERARLERDRVEAEEGMQVNEWGMMLAEIERDAKISKDKLALYQRQLARNQDLQRLAQAQQMAGGEGLMTLLDLRKMQSEMLYMIRMEEINLAMLENRVRFIFASDYAAYLPNSN